MSNQKEENNHAGAQSRAGEAEANLTDVLYALVAELRNYHPLHEPGMWDLTVDQIRATRATMEAVRGVKIRAALGG